MKKLTDEEVDKLTFDFVTDYFKTVSPLEWHLSASEWNFDSGKDSLRWIINNPDTEKATVLMIYWMSGPRWQKQYSSREDAVKKQSWYLNSFDFIQEIEDKYTSGFYTRQSIAYNPACDPEGYNWVNEYSDKVQVREIPAVMLEELTGKTVKRPDDYEEGLPIPIYDKLIELYEAHGVL